MQLTMYASNFQYYWSPKQRLCKKEPLGGAPFIGPRLGDGPIFEVSLSSDRYRILLRGFVDTCENFLSHAHLH